MPGLSRQIAETKTAVRKSDLGQGIIQDKDGCVTDATAIIATMIANCDQSMPDIPSDVDEP